MRLPWLMMILLGCGALPACSTGGVPEAAHPTTVAARTAFTHALPPLDGDHLVTTLVEVTFPPGGGSAPHRHPCAVVGYVIEGTLRTQVSGEREAVYAAGESFYEAPNSAHLVSANASKKLPVRFLAWFTCDQDGSLSVPVEASQAPGDHRR